MVKAISIDDDLFTRDNFTINTSNHFPFTKLQLFFYEYDW